MAWFRTAKNKCSYKTEVIENVVIHVFGSILNISVPGRANLGSLPCNPPSIPTSSCSPDAFKVTAAVTETCSLNCNLTKRSTIGRDYQGVVG